VINRKIAKAVELDVPASVLARASVNQRGTWPARCGAQQAYQLRLRFEANSPL
jgi:hypothetical protein